MSSQKSAVSPLLAAGLGLAALALASFTFLAPAAAAAPAVAGGASQVPEIQFEKYTLPNGLEVILHDDRRAPDRRRQPVVPRRLEERGAGPNRVRAPLRAHDVPGLEERHDEYFSARSRSSAPGGTSTAPPTTTAPTTSRPCRPSNLELALWLESRPDGLPAAGDDQAKLDNQRDVVKNERRQGSRTSPTGAGHELLSKALPERPPLQLAGHRLAWRTSPPPRSTTCRTSSRLLHPEQRHRS